MISGADTKTRTLSFQTNALTAETEVSSVLGLLHITWLSSTWGKNWACVWLPWPGCPWTVMAGGVYQCSTTWTSDIPLPLFLQVHGQRSLWEPGWLEDAMGHVPLKTWDQVMLGSIALLACWSHRAALNRCLDLSSGFPGHVGGVSCCPGSERKEVGSRFSCCLQAWKLLISKKERSNCVVSTFESREEGDHSVKWGNYSLVACVGQSACLLSNT